MKWAYVYVVFWKQEAREIQLDRLREFLLFVFFIYFKNLDGHKWLRKDVGYIFGDFKSFSTVNGELTLVRDLTGPVIRNFLKLLAWASVTCFFWLGLFGGWNILAARFDVFSYLLNTFLALDLDNSPVFKIASVRDGKGSLVALVNRKPIVLKLQVVTSLVENLDFQIKRADIGHALFALFSLKSEICLVMLTPTVSFFTVAFLGGISNKLQ